MMEFEIIYSIIVHYHKIIDYKLKIKLKPLACKRTRLVRMRNNSFLARAAVARS